MIALIFALASIVLYLLAVREHFFDIIPVLITFNRLAPLIERYMLHFT